MSWTSSVENRDEGLKKQQPVHDNKDAHTNHTNKKGAQGPPYRINIWVLRDIYTFNI